MRDGDMGDHGIGHAADGDAEGRRGGRAEAEGEVAHAVPGCPGGVGAVGGGGGVADGNGDVPRVGTVAGGTAATGGMVAEGDEVFVAGHRADVLFEPCAGRGEFRDALGTAGVGHHVGGGPGGEAVGEVGVRDFDIDGRGRGVFAD